LKRWWIGESTGRAEQLLGGEIGSVTERLSHVHAVFTLLQTHEKSSEVGKGAIERR
jgi:hypothetical protein